MIALPNYIDVLEEKYPNLSVTITGDASVYENLTLVDPTQTLPDQATLDADRHTLAGGRGAIGGRPRDVDRAVYRSPTSLPDWPLSCDLGGILQASRDFSDVTTHRRPMPASCPPA